jgi:hypothetical protein
LLVPHRLADGSRLALRLRQEELTTDLELAGTAVWSEGRPPWRLGVAFDEVDRPAALAWFDLLAGHHLDLLLGDRVPDRLDVGTRVYLAWAPEAPPRLDVLETLLLSLACSRPTVSALHGALGASGAQARRAIFSLLHRGALTLDQAEEGDPAGWSLAGRPPRVGAL